MTASATASFETDQNYVRECLNGHPDQYRHLAHRYERVLLSHLLPRCRDRSEAEEATQETLVRAYFWLPNLKKPAAFFSWLLGIADRVALEQQRAQARDRKVAAAAVEKSRGDNSDREGDAVLDEAFESLPDEYRRLILLRYYADLPCKEIAQQLEMPLGTVTKMLSRAYLMLREKLSSSEVKS
jgi:RNA polymerase sigma-70 factor (ECF subfamily)